MLVEIFENVDFGQIFRKILIVVTILLKMFGNLDIGQHFRKILIFSHKF